MPGYRVCTYVLYRRGGLATLRLYVVRRHFVRISIPMGFCIVTGGHLCRYGCLVPEAQDQDQLSRIHA